jgi:hypothetical protein
MRKLDVRSNLNIADIVRIKNLKETHLLDILEASAIIYSSDDLVIRFALDVEGT